MRSARRSLPPRARSLLQGKDGRGAQAGEEDDEERGQALPGALGEATRLGSPFHAARFWPRRSRVPAPSGTGRLVPGPGREGGWPPWRRDRQLQLLCLARPRSGSRSSPRHRSCPSASAVRPVASVASAACVSSVSSVHLCFFGSPASFCRPRLPGRRPLEVLGARASRGLWRKANLPLGCDRTGHGPAEPGTRGG